MAVPHKTADFPPAFSAIFPPIVQAQALVGSLAWGKVKLTLWTHKIDGLTESDFVMAAKADQLNK